MRSVRFLATAAILFALAIPMGTSAAPAPILTTPQLPYDTQYPTIPYATGETSDPVAVLARGLESGEVTLAREGPSAYLAAILRELRIPVSSQMLVFSKTSLLARLIWPETPRAIYFNDRVYVAWTPGADGLEISAQDPELGPVFYNLEPDGEDGPRIRRQTGLCLQCHDSFSLTGAGCPGTSWAPGRPTRTASSPPTSCGRSRPTRRPSVSVGAAGTLPARTATNSTWGTSPWAAEATP